MLYHSVTRRYSVRLPLVNNMWSGNARGGFYVWGILAQVPEYLNLWINWCVNYSNPLNESINHHANQWLKWQDYQMTWYVFSCIISTTSIQLQSVLVSKLCDSISIVRYSIHHNHMHLLFNFNCFKIKSLTYNTGRIHRRGKKRPIWKELEVYFDKREVYVLCVTSIGLSISMYLQAKNGFFTATFPWCLL